MKSFASSNLLAILCRLLSLEAPYFNMTSLAFSWHSFGFCNCKCCEDLPGHRRDTVQVHGIIDFLKNGFGIYPSCSQEKNIYGINKSLMLVRGYKPDFLQTSVDKTVERVLQVFRFSRGDTQSPIISLFPSPRTSMAICTAFCITCLAHLTLT